MNLTGADIPDDEFPEEPHVEEARVPEEMPNAVRLAIIAYPQESGTSQQGIALSRWSEQDRDSNGE